MRPLDNSHEPTPRRPDATKGAGGPVPISGGAAAEPGRPGALRATYLAVREVALVLIIAMGLSLIIKTFLVQAFYIPSASMEDTLGIGDRILVNKLSPGPLDLRRGDIVVFKDPGGWLAPPVPPQDGPLQSAARSALTFVGLLPSDSGEHLIKRVIGLPGDTVARGADGRLTVNGTPIDETYLHPGDEPSMEEFTVTVPAGRLWVMGDHRSVSQDSRFHRDIADGTVPIDNVVGEAFVVVWPLNRLHLLPNPEAVFEPAG